MLQSLLHRLGHRGRILLSPKLYRQARHHPHFRFFRYRLGRHSTDTRGTRLTGITGLWIDEFSTIAAPDFCRIGK